MSLKGTPAAITILHCITISIWIDQISLVHKSEKNTNATTHNLGLVH